MNHKEVAILVKKYVESWINNDSALFISILHDEIMISECYGPIYKGKQACLDWFSDWNKENQVLSWEILDFSYDNLVSKVCFEWRFEYKLENQIHVFFGCSFISLEDGKFLAINEYMTKAERNV